MARSNPGGNRIPLPQADARPARPTTSTGAPASEVGATCDGPRTPPTTGTGAPRQTAGNPA